MYTISIPEEDYKYTVAKPLKVIASFYNKGHIMPLYAEYEGYTIKIDEVLKTKEINDWGLRGIEFLCSYMLGDRRREIKIRYALKEHIWYLPTRNL